MRALDTNVVVRLLVNDDPVQARAAANTIRGQAVFVGRSVLLETEWVLRHAYGLAAERVNAGLTALVDLQHATIEDEAAVREALRWHRAGMDFADALHVAAAAGCQELLTFDRRLAQRAPTDGVSVRLLEG